MSYAGSPFERTTCACAQCVGCCKRQPGPLADGDFERIAAHLGESKEDAKRHFWASPGALVAGMGKIFRVGSITPRFADGRCVFLGADDHCTIHAVAPTGCALFDMHMDRPTADARANWSMRSMMRDAYQRLRATLATATHYNPTNRVDPHAERRSIQHG